MELKPLVVITDDDSTDRYLLKLAFEEAGIDVEVLECEDGEELIHFMQTQCEAKSPRFILLDLNMPKKNGLEVLEFIRNNPPARGVPIIIFSTSSEQNDISKAKMLGAADYIIKPADYQGYIDTVKSLRVLYLAVADGD